ncbi:CsbD family protein [Sphaerimonospora cavernae]|uniref:CsbD family protein n=1 Tax=Sphaerimonospora cavernae TaxID=1740611 RepID=A0ABV6U7R5_9ACTN
MSTEDKFRNKAQEVGGMAKEGVGRAVDDESLEARGQAEQSESKVKQAGEKVKDAAGRVKDAFTD